MKALVILIATTACIYRRTPRPPVCPIAAAAKVVESDTSQARNLAGVFSLRLEASSFKVSRPAASAELALTVLDSAERTQARERRLGHLPRRAPRVGGEVRYMGSETAVPAEVDGVTLYLGCRDCLDASPLVLTIQAVSKDGFWGTWRDYQTGIGEVVDSLTGRPLADPAGRFCAQRAPTNPM